jgi:hypothetical protein
MTRSSYRSILPLLAALILSPALFPYSADAETHVVASSSQQLDLVVHLSHRDLTPVPLPDSTWRYSHVIQVGLPPGAMARVAQAVPSDPVTFTAEHTPLAPNQPLAELGPVYTMRGRQLVPVRLNPVQQGIFYRQLNLTLSFSLSTAGTADPDMPGLAPPDPVFDPIFKTTVANYDQWSRWPTARRPLAKPASGQTPLQSADTWYQIAVTTTGLIRVKATALEAAGLFIPDNGINLDSLYIFNAGGLPLPVRNDSPRPEFLPVAYYAADGGDGRLNTGDYLLFYGEAVDRWVSSPDTAVWVNNHYTDRNIYWLTVGGDFDTPAPRMSALEVTPATAPDTSILTVTRHRHLEQDNMLHMLSSGAIDDYYRWHWTDRENINLSIHTDDYAGGTATIRVAGRVWDTTGFTDDLGYFDITLNNQPPSAKHCHTTSRICTFQSSALQQGTNSLSIRAWGYVYSKPYLDWVELHYNAYLIPDNDRLHIELDPFNGLARLNIVDDFTGSDLLLLDITDPRTPTRLTGADRTTGMIIADLPLNTTPRQLFAQAVSTATPPVSIQRVQPNNLRRTDYQADLIVISTPVLLSAMENWIIERESEGVSVHTAVVNDIMHNFAYGLYDPTAIRDYLKYCYEHFTPPAPSAVLFVGDGHHDFLDHLNTAQSNLVPPYIHALDSSASDDNYVYFGDYGILDADTSWLDGDNRGYEMMVARWPVRSTSEIAAVIDKGKRYTLPGNTGFWKTRTVLVADDEFGRLNDETFHVDQSEELSRYYLPEAMTRHKIYIWDYPFVGRRKPAANDAIVNAVNEGAVIVNYIGHGNPELWADEHVFTRTSDVPRLRNSNSLPLFFNASCAIGFFDDPQREGMAEDLFVKPDGGAIAVVSAARLVYSTQNSAFNRKVFEILFAEDLSMCQAVFAAKVERQYLYSNPPNPLRNDRTYVFFGDPLLKLAYPRLKVAFDAVPDSLVALQPVTVTGRVADELGQPITADGTIELRAFDSDRDLEYLQTPYTLPGPALVRGAASVNAGHFTFTFVPPLDIGYGGSGARIVGYAALGAGDAVGAVTSLAISTQAATTTDSLGPEIRYSFANNDNFISGDPVARTDTLMMTLSDPSGINLAGGLGHGITLEIDGRPENTIMLTDYFDGTLDDYTSGTISWPVSSLEQGLHTFKIKAWDNANNSASVTFSASIEGAVPLAISEFLNYPNPMQDSTRISLMLSRPAQWIILDIFTLSGRKIWTYKTNQSVSAGFFDDIVWYGTDYAADRVATGVYIMKATVSGGGQSAESFGKIVVIN